MTETQDPVALLHGLLNRHERQGGTAAATARIDEDRFHSVADWDAFLAVLATVERKGGVRLVRTRRGGVEHIRTVRLVEPEVVYQVLGRQPSQEGAAAAVASVPQEADGAGFASVIARIEAGWARHRTILGLRPGQSDRLDKAARLARALRRRSQTNESVRQIDYRSFSRDAAGDSKALADTLVAVAALLQADDPARLADLIPEDVVALYGVERLPAPVLISGAVALDGAVLPRAEYLGFPGAVAEHLSPGAPPAYLLTIENYTSFIRHSRECAADDGGLVIYTGGFPSRAVLAALLRLARLSQSTVYHWGDIDPGGLRIFRSLEQALAAEGRRLRPHLMSLELLRERGRPDPQRRRLSVGAAEGSAIAPLWDAMARMETPFELEQEGVAPSRPADPSV